MKLGAAYNVFNGDELLIDSIKRLRKHVDYLVITYQNISNIGIKADKSLLKVINSIPITCYDELLIFNPNLSKKPQINEVNKRNLGLKHARLNQCSHFISIDCDEFYEDDQFENAKNIIIEKGYKSTACELVNYFQSSRFRMIEVKQYVPFIFKISNFKKNKFNRKLPVPVDPTRVTRKDRFYLFERSELLMHHMSYVRKDIQSLKSKLENSPNKHMFSDVFYSYLEYYNNWNPSLPALNPHQFKNKSLIKGTSNIIEVLSPIPLSISYEKTKL